METLLEEGSTTAGLVILLGLILVDAILTAGFAALVNARKQTLRDMAEDGNRRARTALNLAEDATRLLVSRQFVTILLHFLAAAVAILTIAQPLIGQLIEAGINADFSRLAVYLGSWLLTTTFMMLFGELVPNVLVSSQSERMALAVVGPMRLLLRITTPISLLMLWASSRFAEGVGGLKDTPYVTEEEIKTLVDAGSEEGVIETEEKEMIYSIFQFTDKVAREVMVPRIDIVGLEAEDSLESALDVIIRQGHSRIPVYEETIDRVIGLVYAKDLLKLWRDDQASARKARDIMRAAYYAPESKQASELLAEMQSRKIHMAIIIDEYGGTAGLVTIEDLLEEIVGDIQDEYDPEEEAEYQSISPDEYLFDADINLDEVNEMMDLRLSTEESSTLGGYVYSVLGKVPMPGESVETEGVRLTVEALTGRRIRRVRVVRLKPPDTAATAPDAESDRDESGDRGDKTDRGDKDEKADARATQNAPKRATRSNSMVQ